MAKTILILFVLAGILTAPEDLSSCGPFLPETLFAGKVEPFDEARYYSGRLDIIGPQYARIYLMAAYRYLAGTGLNQADQEALMARQSGPDFWNDQGSEAIGEWLRLRVALGAPQIDRIERFKVFADNVYILNCGDDAFRNAAATLTERGRAGAARDDLRIWVAAQDQVFANCSSATRWQPDPPGQTPHMPGPLAAGAPPWMQADHAYQVAAAEFYAGRFDDAANDFRRIAEDRSSAWHGMAPYLEARALIRKATLVDPDAAVAARHELQQVLADPGAARWHESARGLLRFLQARTDPRAALNELAHAVATEKNGVAASMRDYRLVLARFDQQTAPRDEDITDWIATFENGPAEHAMEKWRGTRSTPWLVAALRWASRADAEMMGAAASVADVSPGYLTIQFHGLRLMPADEARRKLDVMLRRKMPVPARNLFLAERMRVARNWDEMLRFAPRTEAGSEEAGTLEEPATRRPKRYFDEDGARILDRQATLETLRASAGSVALPANLRLQVARAVWVRAVMLEDTRTAQDMAPVLASLAPNLKPALDGYVAADEKGRAFAAAWLLLNNPGMRPGIEAGAERQTPARRIDNFRDNWWCAADKKANLPINAALNLLYQGTAPAAAFQTEAQRAKARQERARMDAFPAAPTFMARQAVAWATAHPDDPRAPEALRLAVRAGRFACGGDQQSSRWTKRAFRLLHGRYAGSDAARRTPYWYATDVR